MADEKQQEVEKDKVATVEEEGVASRVIKFLKFASNYGKEDRYDPDFTWTKYIIRTVGLNLLATLIAFRITMYFLSDAPVPFVEPTGELPDTSHLDF